MRQSSSVVTFTLSCLLAELTRGTSCLGADTETSQLQLKRSSKSLLVITAYRPSDCRLFTCNKSRACQYLQYVHIILKREVRIFSMPKPPSEPHLKYNAIQNNRSVINTIFNGAQLNGCFSDCSFW